MTQDVILLDLKLYMVHSVISCTEIAVLKTNNNNTPMVEKSHNNVMLYSNRTTVSWLDKYFLTVV